MSDLQLMAGIATGDTHAFEVLYERFAPRVFGLLSRLLHDHAAAEDVLQDTFLQVWRIAERYDPERSSPEVWVLLLARSRALDHLRRRRLLGESPSGFEPFTWPDPAASLEHAETAQHVREYLDQLPVEQSTAIQLAFFGGLTHEQIAKHQSISLGTAKTRLRLGMKRLSRLMCATPERTAAP